MAELKPCPFCGGGTTAVKENGKVWMGTRYSEPSSVSIQHWCDPVAGQPSRMLERVGRDLDSAIEAWNRRTSIGDTPAPQSTESALGAAIPPALSEDQIEAMAREDAGGPEIDWTNKANLFATAPQRAAFRRGVKAALALGVSVSRDSEANKEKG